MNQLSEFDNQVLRTVAGRAAKGGADGFWTEPPRTEEVAAALRHLASHRMIVRKGGSWWLVRPTAKGLKHLAARKLRKGKAYLARSDIKT